MWHLMNHSYYTTRWDHYSVEGTCKEYPNKTLTTPVRIYKILWALVVFYFTTSCIYCLRSMLGVLACFIRIFFTCAFYPLFLPFWCTSTSNKWLFNFDSFTRNQKNNSAWIDRLSYPKKYVKKKPKLVWRSCYCSFLNKLLEMSWSTQKQIKLPLAITVRNLEFTYTYIYVHVHVMVWD